MVANTLDRMFLTTTWLEGILYGINCVLFGACIYILTNRKGSHRILCASCIFHISVSTAHYIISLLQALKGFTTSVGTSIPGGAYFIMATTLMLTNLGLYLFNVVAQDLLLIWRLYVVWNRNWKLATAAVIVEAAHLACGLVSLVMIAQPNLKLDSHIVQAPGKASWTFDVFLNTTVTCGIAYRLWRAGRDVSDLAGRNLYKSAMFTVIESGALIATCTLIMFALDIAGGLPSLASFMAVNVAVQIATTTPLLIIARVGLGLTHGDVRSEQSTSRSVMFAPPVRINIAQDTTIGTYPMDSISKTQKAESIQSYGGV